MRSMYKNVWGRIGGELYLCVGGKRRGNGQVRPADDALCRFGPEGSGHYLDELILDRVMGGGCRTLGVCLWCIFFLLGVGDEDRMLW